MRNAIFPAAIRRLATFALLGGAAAIFSPEAALAQKESASGHIHAVMPVTADMRELVDAARRATAALDSPDAARAAGYVSVFGNVPLQGEHFARPDLVILDSFVVERPAVLMFAPVNGIPALVGVAYTFQLPPERMQPKGWIGATEVWHSHDDIARAPGKRLVMMHTWFVETPAGPFAHHNPWLPYYAAGIAPPAAGSDDTARENAARLGMGLGLVTAPPLVLDAIQRRAPSALAERMASVREKILTAISGLRAAEQTGDTTEFRRLGRDVTALGDTLVALYREAARGAPRLEAAVNDVVGAFLRPSHGQP